MDKRIYLSKLLDLKAFLKENPEHIKTYSDVRIDYQIDLVKYEIYLEEQEELKHEYLEQNRSDCDAFIRCDESPFL